MSIVQNIGQHQIEYSEGFMIYLSNLFAAGNFDYTISQFPPFMISFYTPVFYLVYGKLISFFSDPWLTGRIFMLLCTIGCMVMVFLIVHRVSRNKLIALISTLLPLTQYVVIQWSMVIRVDMLAMFFELAGLYIAVRFWKTRWIYLSIPLFLLAFYTKQSFFMGAVAVAIALIIQELGKGLVYTGLIGTILLISLGVAQALTEGQFINQILTFQQTSPVFKDFSGILGFVLLPYYPLIPILFSGILYTINNKYSPLAIFAGLSFVLNLFLLCRAGSAYNYQFEVIFSFCIVGGMGISYFIQRKEWIYTAVFVLVTAVVLSGKYPLAFPDDAYQIKYQQAVNLVSDAKYPILTENPGIVIDAGKTPYLVDPFMFSMLPKFGKFDNTKLLEDLKQEQIEYVITQEKLPQGKIIRFSGEVQQSILNNYEIVMDNSNEGFGFVVYEAKNK